MKIEKKKLIEIVKNSQCVSDVLRSLNLSSKGSYNHKNIKKLFLEYDIDISHFDANKVRGRKNSLTGRKCSINEILVSNSSYKNMTSLKNRLINANIFKYECTICKNIGMWNNKKLVLQIDHINGITNDHQIDNLRLLCPNCHSQTKNYCGKNKKT